MNWPHLHAVQLYEEVLFPVCSPALAEGDPPLRVPADIARHTLLHLDYRDDWRKWLRAAGVEDAVLDRGAVMNQINLAIDAAVGGQGIALARTALAARDLLDGRLVRPFGPNLAVSYGYYVVCPKRYAEETKIAIFRDWMLAEVAAEREALGALLQLSDR
ncbi:MAG: LysR substrate-binding domain-containing protein [Proteobacteria bacterium]|nr:LysR substrate-binding domain-containing protein [Pseudomonadota bacterium]